MYRLIETSYLNNLLRIQPEVKIAKEEIWHVLIPLVSDPTQRKRERQWTYQQSNKPILVDI